MAKYENVENISKLISGGAIGDLTKKVGVAEKQTSDILKKLSDLENVKKAKKEEENIASEKAAAEAAKALAEQEAKKQREAKEAEEAAKKAAEDTAKKLKEAKEAEEAAKKAEAVRAEEEAEKARLATKAEAEKKANEQKVVEQKAFTKPAERPTQKPADFKSVTPQRTDRPQQRPADNRGDNRGDRFSKPADRGDRPPRDNTRDGARRDFNGANGVRSQQPFGDRKPRPTNGDNKTFVNRDGNYTRPAQNGQRPQRPANGNFAGNGAPRTQQSTTRPSLGRFNSAAAAAPVVQPAKSKNFGPDKKKQNFDKTYVEKEKHTVSKRALQKQQGASIDDFDEDKSGYRKLRLKKDKKEQTTQAIKIEKAVVTSNEIPIKLLSEKLGISAVDITKRLFKEGIMKTVNEFVDYDTAALLAAGLGIELEYKPEKTAEEVLIEKQADTVEEIESLVPRAPVVTVMGHVDHGKTSLLDYIRKSNAAAGEAGGITQHIGAYTVTVNGKGITFIDTPGHEAFTAMRARGAQVTDIVILVVAADDGIMPQTIEAINHAKAANVSIIVAVNKMDKAGANLEKVKQELTNQGLVPEDWGGDTPVCPISCKTGEGIDNLLENLLLVAEMKELLANPAREARGVVIEARLDKGKGPVATVLIQNGTLHTGDNIISGTVTGRVRAMIDDKGKSVKEATPSMAVNVLGLEEVPNSGDSIFAVSQELMKQVIDERKRKESDARVSAASKISLDEVFGKIAEGNMKTLNLIIKGDVQGSVEAVKQSVSKLSNEEVQVKVIHSGAGAVTETDVMLADSSNAIILGFNVRPDAKAKQLAERSKVDIRTYRIIYDLLDDIEAALKGMLAPKYHEVYLGKCEVRQTFKITGVGNIAGCYVLEGKIVRGGKLRIYRDDVLVVEGNVQQLKRFKDDVKEVAFGFECGCAIEGFNDIKVGDIIECYMIEQIAVQ
jgi:translation initiation factor IF-2